MNLLTVRALSVLHAAACLVGGCVGAAAGEPSGSSAQEEPRAEQSDVARRDAGAQVAAAANEVVTEQVFRELRPEFLDYFWNNLDPARFEQWHPAAHDTFAWTRAPEVPGDLGAEVGASYTARATIAGAPHELRVTYVDPRLSDNGVTLESAMAADVWIDGAGPLRLVVQYEQQGDDVRVQQRLALPPAADRAAYRTYLEERMTTLAGFIREPFQKQYVDQELTKRGKVQVTPGLLTTDVVVIQEIGKVSPQMVDWWWDNMGGTERYRHWHPTAHQKFTWTMPPKNSSDLVYDVGSVQQVVEVIGESSTLNITWLDPKQVPIPRTYPNFIYGSTNLEGTPFGGFLLHEYEALPRGGIIMKSTFRIPALSGEVFAQALGQHCIQEMQFLQYYLPRLFAAKYMP